MSFPTLQHLSSEACNDIRKRLRNSLFPDDSDVRSPSSLAIVCEVAKLQRAYEHVTANADSFNLAALVSSLKIRPQESVFINWYRFDVVDCMLLSDLARHFHDIWYPGSDDIDVFDESLTWILSIDHDGYVKFARIKGSELLSP